MEENLIEKKKKRERERERLFEIMSVMDLVWNSMTAIEFIHGEIVQELLQVSF
jgi:hypothetical protein